MFGVCQFKRMSLETSGIVFVFLFLFWCLKVLRRPHVSGIEAELSVWSSLAFWALSPAGKNSRLCSAGILFIYFFLVCVLAQKGVETLTELFRQDPKTWLSLVFGICVWLSKTETHVVGSGVATLCALIACWDFFFPFQLFGLFIRLFYLGTTPSELSASGGASSDAQCWASLPIMLLGTPSSWALRSACAPGMRSSPLNHFPSPRLFCLANSSYWLNLVAVCVSAFIWTFTEETSPLTSRFIPGWWFQTLALCQNYPFNWNLPRVWLTAPH